MTAYRTTAQASGGGCAVKYQTYVTRYLADLAARLIVPIYHRPALDSTGSSSSPSASAGTITNHSCRAGSTPSYLVRVLVAFIYIELHWPPATDIPLGREDESLQLGSWCPTGHRTPAIAA